jgi:electron transport complex protein RnfG
MPKIKIFFQQSWLLIVSSFFFGLLIAAANAAWEGRIDYNVNVYKFNKVAKEVLPEAADFNDVSQKIEVETGREGKIAVPLKKAVDSSGQVIGWLFTCQGAGFADQVKLILAVDARFEKILGFGVLSSNETPNFGDKIKLPYYRDQYVGAPAEKLTLVKTGDPKKIDSDIVAISGATISSQAVVTIINQFLPQVKEQMKSEGLIGNG